MPKIVEEPVLIPFSITLTSGQVARSQPVPIEPDSDFLLTGIHGTSTGSYNINFRLPGGRNFATVPVKNANLVGTAAQPTAIGPAPLYRRGSNGPVIDSITDTSGATNTIELCFTGVRQTTIGS